MLCKECKSTIALSAFSEGICNICGRKVIAPHIPCYNYCKICSIEKAICQQCGKNIEQDIKMLLKKVEETNFKKEYECEWIG